MAMRANQKACGSGSSYFFEDKKDSSYRVFIHLHNPDSSYFFEDKKDSCYRVFIHFHNPDSSYFFEDKKDSSYRVLAGFTGLTSLFYHVGSNSPEKYFQKICLRV